MGESKPGPQKEANRVHARLRGPGERANAQLKTRESVLTPVSERLS
jgi:hypothetical protein